MLSASPGSLSKRYRSAFSKAAGIASSWSDFSSGMAIGRRARSDAPYLGRAGSPCTPLYIFALTLQRFNVFTISFLLQPPPDPAKRIIKVIHHTFLQGDDAVVRDLNTFRANLRATFGDVAVADSLRVSQFFNAIFRIERLHLLCCHVVEETWSDEFLMHLVVAQHVAHVLTEKTFDALPKFLHAINVFLLHAPCAIWSIGRARFELLN